MKYNITHANGTALIFDDTVVDKKSTSLVLVGQQSSDYGYYFWNNIVHILENFSSPYEPNNKQVGQLWFKNDAKDLRVYTGQQWQSVIPPVIDMTNYVHEADSKITGTLTLNGLPSPTTPNVAITRGFVETTYKYSFKNESAATANIKHVTFANNYVIMYSVMPANNTEVREIPITLPATMADVNYSIMLTFNDVDGKPPSSDLQAVTYNKTKAGFTIKTNKSFVSIAWVVMGFAE